MCVAGDGVPTVFVAVAGRSNGLGPVLSGHATYPVINCPPVAADWGPHEIWSSLRLPTGTSLIAYTQHGVVVLVFWSGRFLVYYLCCRHWRCMLFLLRAGLGCTTVLTPEAAALSVAQIIGLTNHVVWAKLRAQQLNQRVALKEADRKAQQL